MYELDHPHVMKFREWYETTNHLWLVMDLCDGMKRTSKFSLNLFFLRWIIKIDYSSRWIITGEFHTYDWY